MQGNYRVVFVLLVDPCDVDSIDKQAYLDELSLFFLLQAEILLGYLREPSKGGCSSSP